MDWHISSANAKSVPSSSHCKSILERQLEPSGRNKEPIWFCILQIKLNHFTFCYLHIYCFCCCCRLIVLDFKYARDWFGVYNILWYVNRSFTHKSKNKIWHFPEKMIHNFDINSINLWLSNKKNVLISPFLVFSVGGAGPKLSNYGFNGDFRIVGGKPAKTGEFRGQVSEISELNCIPDFVIKSNWWFFFCRFHWSYHYKIDFIRIFAAEF